MGDHARLLLPHARDHLEVLAVRILELLDPAARVVVGPGVLLELAQVGAPGAEQQRDAVVTGRQHEAMRTRHEPGRAVRAPTVGEQDRAVARCLSDALVDLLAQDVRSVVQEPFEVLDGDVAAKRLDLVPDGAAGNDLVRRHDERCHPFSSCRSSRADRARCERGGDDPAAGWCVPSSMIGGKPENASPKWTAASREAAPLPPLPLLGPSARPRPRPGITEPVGGT